MYIYIYNVYIYISYSIYTVYCCILSLSTLSFSEFSRASAATLLPRRRGGSVQVSRNRGAVVCHPAPGQSLEGGLTYRQPTQLPGPREILQSPNWWRHTTRSLPPHDASYTAEATAE